MMPWQSVQEPLASVQLASTGIYSKLGMALGTTCLSVAAVIQSCGQAIAAAMAGILYVSRLRDSQRAIIQKGDKTRMQ